MSAKKKFTILEPAITVPVCNDCKHYITGRRCRAFDTIPDSILDGDNNHSTPLPNQGNQVVFQEKS